MYYKRSTVYQPRDQVQQANLPESLKAVTKKRSHKEQRELEQLEKELPLLETEKSQLTDALNSDTLSYETLQQHSDRILEITELLEEKEMRWLELSEG